MDQLPRSCVGFMHEAAAEGDLQGKQQSESGTRSAETRSSWALPGAASLVRGGTRPAAGGWQVHRPCLPQLVQLLLQLTVHVGQDVLAQLLPAGQQVAAELPLTKSTKSGTIIVLCGGPCFRTCRASALSVARNRL